MLANGTDNMARIAEAVGVQRQKVYRLKADPTAAEAALAAWGM
jgi:pyrroloquinoline quinone (PQQ) biosynthesis protein C